MMSAGVPNHLSPWRSISAPARLSASVEAPAAAAPSWWDSTSEAQGLN